MENEHTTEDNESPVDSGEAKGVSLSWRILAGVLAVAVIGVLALPLFQGRSNTANDARSSGASVSSQNATSVTSSADTPQADPNSAEAQFRLGNQYYEAGQWDQAVAAYERAIELDPTFQGAYANLGVTYYQQQEFALAASQYEKALELDPEDGEVAYNLGALFLQQALSQNGSPNLELLNEAVAQLETALQISPNLAEPHFTLGVAYFFLENQEEATNAFEKYLALASNADPQAEQEAKRYLEALRAQ